LIIRRAPECEYPSIDDRREVPMTASVLPLHRREEVEPVSVARLADARDGDLLRGIAAGDEAAFRGLYRRYAASSYGLAVRIVKQEFLAEEIVQETFLALWRGAGAYDPSRGSVRTWLLSSIHHRAVDAVRREEAHTRRALRVQRESIPAPDIADDVAYGVDLAGERAQVRDALDALPAEQAEVVTLMYFGGLSQAQVAERLALPLGTVKSRCLLAMRRLRTALVGSETS
jgi:RNA polymerase sigma factor (sigma-70 family)